MVWKIEGSNFRKDWLPNYNENLNGYVWSEY